MNSEMKHNRKFNNEPLKPHLDTPLLPVGCVIMASGFGRRFGGNKLLAPFQGKPLISYILDTVSCLPFFSVLAVTRYPEIAALCEERNIPVLMHQLPKRSDTVRLGLAALMEHTSLSGCMFCPADQPLLLPESLEALLHTFSHSPESICRLSYLDVSGSPTLFPSKLFEELLSLPTGKGGAYLAKKYPHLVQNISAQNESELYDIDTPEDLTRSLK